MITDKINLRKTCSVLTPLLISQCTLATGNQHPGNNKLPNIIIIFTDDQGYGDVGCYGAKGFSTPNLDKMAEEGIRFTDFYTAASVSTPSRAALLTGCYPVTMGLHKGVLYPFSKTGLNPDETIIPEVLSPMGYKTACIGKWHLGHLPQFMPDNQGFDFFYGVPYSNDMDGYKYNNPEYQSPPLPVYINDSIVERGMDQGQLTQRWTNAAVKYIRENKDHPFFLYVAHNMPHLPWHASEKFRGTTELGLYGDVISEIDWSVGEILNTLKEVGIDNHTLVIFTSDNGAVSGKEKGGTNGILRGAKATTWDGGLKVPCIMRWPEYIPSNSVCSQLVTIMDILPTIASITNSNHSLKHVDGNDISGLLADPSHTKTPTECLLYYARNGDLEAIRYKNWKLHIAKSLGWNQSNGEFQRCLYNLEADPGERTDISQSNPRIVRKLEKILRKKNTELLGKAREIGK